MQNARDRSLRQEIYKAYSTIASEQSDPDLDNSALIEQLLALRAEEAALLGYSSFAALRLKTRMAATAVQVLDFLRQLAAKAKLYATPDLAQLRAFAREKLDIAELQLWDIPFALDGLREERYANSDETGG